LQSTKSHQTKNLLATGAQSINVDAGVADSMRAIQIRNRDAGLVFRQNPNDLFFRKAAASCSRPRVGPKRTSNWITMEGQRYAEQQDEGRAAGDGMEL
jgi:hypothetical protein